MINGRDFLNNTNDLRRWVNAHIAKYVRKQMSPEQIQEFKILFNLEVLHQLVGLNADENESGELLISLPTIGPIAGSKKYAEIIEMIQDVDSVIFKPYCEECGYEYKDTVPEDYSGTEKEIVKYMLGMLTEKDFENMYNKAISRRNKKRIIVGGASVVIVAGVTFLGYYAYKKWFE